MAERKIARHHNFKRWYLALGSCFTVFILGSMLMLPIWDRRSGIEIIQDALTENNTVLGDSNQSPYTITNFIPPENSFGMDATTFKLINWSYFKTFFTQHTSWLLEYKRYASSSWTNGNQYLTIDKAWNDTGFWKINLTLTVPVNVYSARFTFACDLNVLDYIEKNGTEIWLDLPVADTNDTYSVFFNWSDIASIPNLQISKGRTDNKFWFRMQKNNIAKGTYVFDPTFGYTGAKYSQEYICYNNYDKLYLSYGLCGSNGYADYISVYFVTLGGTYTFQAALYSYVDYSSSFAGNLIAKTAFRTVTNAGNASKWTTFYFNTTGSAPDVRPKVNASTNYYLAVKPVSYYTGNSQIGNQSGYPTSNAKGCRKTRTPHVTVYAFDNPITGEGVYSGIGSYLIYCTYTKDNVAPVITASSQNPLNQSTKVGLSLVGNSSRFAISVTDADDTLQNMNITWTTNETTGVWHTMGTNTSVNNGTYRCSNVTWVDENSKKYWWGVQLNDGKGGWDNETYYFTTVAGASKTWKNVSNYNGSISNDSNWLTKATYNGTIYNNTIFTITNQYNGSIYNSSSYRTINLYNGTIFNNSAFNLMNTYNGTVFNNSNYNIVNLYNGTIFNTSSFKILYTYNGSLWNQSQTQILNIYNGTIFNNSNYNIVNLYNGTILNNTNYNIVNLYNGTLLNNTNFNTVNLYNGSLWNQSLLQNLYNYNGTLFNNSNFNLVNQYNGTITNNTNFNTINNYNGTIFNSSNYNILNEYNGSLYNLSTIIMINEFNGTIQNNSAFITITIMNGTLFNNSILETIITYNGTIFNASLAIPISTYNGTIFNNSIDFIWIVNETPSNNTKNVDLHPVLFGTFMNLVGRNMNISWYYGNSTINATHLLGNTTGILNQTIFNLFVNASHYSRWYYWRVNVTDTGGHYLNQTFRFKTETHYGTGMVRNIRMNEFMLIGMIIAFAFAIFFIKKRGRKNNNEYLPENE